MNEIQSGPGRSANASIDKSSAFRKMLLDAAMTFKSNWVSFGELLTRTATEKQYEAWGFKSFEEYCTRELRIKKNTAVKLTNAYFFVTETDPKISQLAENKGYPDLEVVNFLHRTKESENCPPEIYEELRDSALDKGQSGTTLARKFKELTAINSPDPAKTNVEQSLTLVNRLQQKIKPIGDVPPKFVDYLAEIEKFLQEAKVKTT